MTHLWFQSRGADTRDLTQDLALRLCHIPTKLSQKRYILRVGRKKKWLLRGVPLCTYGFDNFCLHLGSKGISTFFRVSDEPCVMWLILSLRGASSSQELTKFTHAAPPAICWRHIFSMKCNSLPPSWHSNKNFHPSAADHNYSVCDHYKFLAQILPSGVRILIKGERIKKKFTGSDRTIAALIEEKTSLPRFYICRVYFGK